MCSFGILAFYSIIPGFDQTFMLILPSDFYTLFRKLFLYLVLNESLFIENFASYTYHLK